MSNVKITKIKKRDGRLVEFDKEKVVNAIFKAAESVGGSDIEIATDLADKVVELVFSKFDPKQIPTVEDIQDSVEKVLIEEGHAKTAKSFIIYRQQHAEMRKMKKNLIGTDDSTKLTPNALRIAQARYLRRDEQGDLIETPEQMFKRVAKTLSSIEKKYNKNFDVKKLEADFFEAMSNLEFLPGGRTLSNAGTEVNQLANCFVLPVEDSMESIFQTVLETALIQKVGGGTGFSFSKLRPKGDIVIKSKGIASGPISFITVFDAATEVIRQGGNRRGANMGVLRVDHPDIVEFITAKEQLDVLNNFNLSVAVTDEFMKAVKENKPYALRNPRDFQPIKEIDARKIFDLMVTMAWKNGEPGCLFIDTINKANPTPHVGPIEATNPCGEVPLLPYEACNLASINLSRFVSNKKVNYERLEEVVKLATRFLDNVIDVCKYPIPKIDKMVKANRKIGLGVMGFADMLLQLEVKYDSDKGIKVADEVMGFIQKTARKMSEQLAEEKGVFPNYEGSIFDGKMKVRNATVTSIAPTGTLSMLAETSGGIEPQFAICYVKRVLENNELLYVNKYLEQALKAKGVYSEELMREIAKKGGLHGIEKIPQEIRDVFVISHEIAPEWHVKMQAIFQKHVDNSISKTINFPNYSSMEEIEKGFLLAYESGCKGVTVYRDGSRQFQVMNVGSGKSSSSSSKAEDDKEIDIHKEEKKLLGKKAKKCPECGTDMEQKEGCATCPKCAYSPCTI